MHEKHSQEVKTKASKIDCFVDLAVTLAPGSMFTKLFKNLLFDFHPIIVETLLFKALISHARTKAMVLIWRSTLGHRPYKRTLLMFQLPMEQGQGLLYVR